MMENAREAAHTIARHLRDAGAEAPNRTDSKEFQRVMIKFHEGTNGIYPTRHENSAKPLVKQVAAAIASLPAELRAKVDVNHEIHRTTPGPSRLEKLAVTIIITPKAPSPLATETVGRLKIRGLSSESNLPPGSKLKIKMK